MISFSPTEEQELIVDTVRRFAVERMQPAAHDADENRTIPMEVIATGWDMGLLAGLIPEAYGGFAAEQAAVSTILAAEELGYGDLSMALYLMTPHLFAMPILHNGTEEQKRRWLPGIVEGGFRPYTAALVEPRWDFNPAALATSATPDADGYVINGRKAYVPLAADAPAMLVYAREGQQTQAFIVEKGSAGLTVHEREQHMGIRALPSYEVSFENVRVGRDAKLGGEAGCNSELLMNYSRVGISALALGVARGAYEYALNYAKQRETFGRPIAQYQAIAFMLAEMAIEIESARGLVWEAAWMLDTAKDATRSAALAKHYTDNAVLFVTDRAVQILGGHGYIREHPVERWLRDGRGFASFLGLTMI